MSIDWDGWLCPCVFPLVVLWIILTYLLSSETLGRLRIRSQIISGQDEFRQRFPKADPRVAAIVIRSIRKVSRRAPREIKASHQLGPDIRLDEEARAKLRSAIFRQLGVSLPEIPAGATVARLIDATCDDGVTPMVDRVD